MVLFKASARKQRQREFLICVRGVVACEKCSSLHALLYPTFNLRQILLKIKQEIKWKRPSAWIAARPQSVRNDGQERDK
ncbi:hypothetical protein OUZ56_000791 [Daphnia magna]|uniref:Uncharacterized protein n=1 Tax=Daphnia magna TaxID=35525 RepID=A0ABR0A0W8_9CRUS|nr:hypothetical protein OUZ56_000791 [Daphnia magna]